VILNAQSGAGKTSLINTRLEELLEKHEFKIHKIKNLNSGIESSEAVDNIFTHSVSLSLTQNGKIPSEQNHATLLKIFEEIDPQLPDHRFVIIFDQFEELFTSHQERWQDREPFLQQIQEIGDKYPMSRIVFAIREDFLGRFNSYAHIWKKVPYNFHLELLNRKKALLAVREPTRKTERKYDEGVAEKIVEELSKIRIEKQNSNGNGNGTGAKFVEVPGEYVEPVQLQIVCKTLWDSLRPEDELITLEHLKEIGGVESVLESFYDKSLKKALARYPHKEKIVRDWLEISLITPVGTRDSFLKSKIGDVGIPLPVIKSLVESYLLRTEVRAGASWYCLSHDRFIEPIRKSNRKWMEKQLQQEQEAQQQRIQQMKKQFISYILLAVAFIIPLFLLTVFYWLPSRSTSAYDRALKYLYDGKKSYYNQNFRSAEKSFENSLENQTLVEASLYLARTYEKLSETSKAIEQYHQTIQLDSNYAEAYYDLGLLLVRTDRKREGFDYLIRYLELSKKLPRVILPAEVYTELVVDYFRSRIISADATYRRQALDQVIDLIRRHIPYTPMGTSPSQGFDDSGFISFILRKANVLKEQQVFDLGQTELFTRTNEPMPMDLIVFPAFNRTALFYLGDFFGERLCVGVGLTAFVDIVNISQFNYPYLFYRVRYF